MKITHIDIYRFSIKMEPFTIATGTMTATQNVLIRVHTDQGLYGVGECSAFPVVVGETQETCLAMAKDFAKIWKGKDASDIPGRLHELNLYTAYNPTAKSAFDMALYDLAAKAANQPLYQYLGGSKRSIETDITIGISSPEEMATQAKEFKSKGASMIKVKLGKGVNEDLERIRAIRQAVGPEIKLRLDANQGWEFDEAGYAFQAMEELDIQFCEQPMRTWYDDYLPELVQKSPVKIMADESCYHHHDARKLIAKGATDYLNIKFAKSGGIAEAQRIADIAEKNNTPCMIGCMLESRLALSANLHFAYANPTLQFFDLDSCMTGPLEDPVVGGVSYNGFLMEMEDQIGIGADVDEAFLKNCEKFTV
ncbi:mandelate racemase/muconate lactonizing enzyme family protein [Rufibacter roseus]|uniref:Dipeptide epimerase n=1 Tax=Rufibacter roseus TaxID=1567108 RepID=A0ABW2DIM9_9BACT|nr:dipeptide epimerase [Rufibacter roseus]